MAAEPKLAWPCPLASFLHPGTRAPVLRKHLQSHAPCCVLTGSGKRAAAAQPLAPPCAPLRSPQHKMLQHGGSSPSPCAGAPLQHGSISICSQQQQVYSNPLSVFLRLVEGEEQYKLAK